MNALYSSICIFSSSNQNFNLIYKDEKKQASDYETYISYMSNRRMRCINKK